MKAQESNAYILGTDDIELHRLGLQHQIWSSEAQQAWVNGKITNGLTVLDLGSGPGFCSSELAFLTGSEGKVIAVDRSKHFIDIVNNLASLHKLNIDGLCQDFNELNLRPDSLDRMFCRWALAWIDNPDEILEKVYNSLKPGGKMIIHEYFDWSTLQTEPAMSGLTTCIQACLKSFNEGPGNIDIGRKLPSILHNLGMRDIEVRMMHKFAHPSDTVWEWPRTFFESYFPRLVDMNYLIKEECQKGLSDMTSLAQMPNSVIFCPIVTEVIATKP